ncbi:MAG: hypothetical protein U0939_07115 [Pirellulales bacterium]
MKIRWLQRLWRDERAFVVSSELILISTIAVIGLIVGLATYRDALVQELGDTGAAIGAVNQSYSVEVLSGTGISVAVDGEVTVTRTYGTAPDPVITVSGSFYNFDYTDLPDVCEVLPQAPGSPPAGIDINQTPIDEGDVLP